MDDLIRPVNLPKLLEGHPLRVGIQQCDVAAVVVHRRPTSIKRKCQVAGVNSIIAIHHPIEIDVLVEGPNQWGVKPVRGAVHVHHGIDGPLDARGFQRLAADVERSRERVSESAIIDADPAIPLIELELSRQTPERRRSDIATRAFEEVEAIELQKRKRVSPGY